MESVAPPTTPLTDDQQAAVDQLTALYEAQAADEQRADGWAPDLDDEGLVALRRRIFARDDEIATAYTAVHRAWNWQAPPALLGAVMARYWELLSWASPLAERDELEAAG